MRKATKVKFFFDNGDEVTVLTKDDNERECLHMLARAIMCNRKKEGNMKEVYIMVHRDGGIKQAQRATPGTMTWMTTGIMTDLIEGAPEKAKLLVASKFLTRLAAACGLDLEEEDDKKEE